MSEKLKTIGMNERRLQIFWIGESDLMQVLQGRALVSGIPHGAKLKRVEYSFERMAFGLMCFHESFLEFPEGAVVPWGGPLTMQSLPTTSGSIVGDIATGTKVDGSFADWAITANYIITETKPPAELMPEPTQESWRDRPSLL